MKKEMYNDRLQRLKKEIKKHECDTFLVENTTDLYYLTGIALSLGSLLIHKKRADLIVDARYFEKCRKKSPFPVILAKEDLLRELLKKHKTDTLGFDSANTSYERYLELKKWHSKLKSIPHPVLDVRNIKDRYEIKLLKKAATLGSLGYDFVLSQLKEGVTEIEVADRLEIFWKEQGGRGLAFRPIIAFGKNSSMPHYSPGAVKLKKGDPVLIDIGVNLNQYHSDMTRVVFFGPPNSKMLEIYQVVKQAQEEALKLCRPNTKIGDLDGCARKVIEKHGFGDKFTHSLGHGIGLDVHEGPVLRNKPPYKDVLLKPGMVITIEPGIYLPNLGGVRIEDTVCITEKGHQNLTKRPKTACFI